MAGRTIWLTLRSRSWIGLVNCRSVSASSATSRCTVLRIVSNRTSERDSSPRVTSYGSKVSSRAASPKYGGWLSCACIPTRCSTIAGTADSVRASRCCRASSVRFSTRAESSMRVNLGGT